MPQPHTQCPTHCVIIPSYNSGPLLATTLRATLAQWAPVFLVVDGSTDSSERCADALIESGASLEVLRLEKNQGKGGAVFEAFKLARSKGLTHAVVFDSDGQHEAADIPRMIALSKKHPEAMVLGVPIFSEDAPELRVKGRRVGNWWTNFETLWGGIEDSLFGFRIYPIAESIAILSAIEGGRRFDFETQLAVRLYWRGIPSLSFPSKVTYPEKASGGVSHFKYLRDNVLLFWTHFNLSLRAVCMLPRLLELRLKNRAYRG
jgi:glycosyltransferase involved in cell wall biosynthesis